MKKLSFELESILLDTLFANGLAAMYLTKANAVLYSGLTVLINLPVANFTGIFNITLPAHHSCLYLLFLVLLKRHY